MAYQIFDHRIFLREPARYFLVSVRRNLRFGPYFLPWSASGTVGFPIETVQAKPEISAISQNNEWELAAISLMYASTQLHLTRNAIFARFRLMPAVLISSKIRLDGNFPVEGVFYSLKPWKLWFSSKKCQLIFDHRRTTPGPTVGWLQGLYESFSDHFRRHRGAWES